MLSSPADGMQVGQYSEGSLLVEMGYIIQGSCFKFLRAPSHMKQNVHFDTFFIKIGQKMRQCRPKNINPARGVCGGSENDNLGQICYFTLYFNDFIAVMYLSEVKDYISESFVKIGPFVLNKMAVLRQIKARGRFCCHTHMLIYLYVF